MATPISSHATPSDRPAPPGDQREEGRRVAVLCPTLGTRCGIGTYTEMLCDAKGYRGIREVRELGGERVDVLHLQHEYGIFPPEMFEEVVRYCQERQTRLFVTLHRVEKTSYPTLVLVLYDALRRRYVLRRARRSLHLSGPKTPADASRSDRSLMGKARLLIEDFMERRRYQPRILERSNGVVVHAEDAMRELRRQGGTDIHVMAHPLRMVPTSGTLRSEADGKLHVGYFGFLSPAKDLSTLIEACGLLPNVVLHLLASVPGDGEMTEYARAFIDLVAQHEWIDLNVDFLPLERIVHELSQNDVNVYLTTGVSHGFSSSGSIRQYLAAKRPVIANRSVLVSDLEDVITVVADMRPSMVAEAIRNVDPDTSAIEAYCPEHTWEGTPDVYGPGD